MVKVSQLKLLVKVMGKVDGYGLHEIPFILTHELKPDNPDLTVQFLLERL